LARLSDPPFFPAAPRPGYPNLLVGAQARTTLVLIAGSKAVETDEVMDKVGSEPHRSRIFGALIPLAALWATLWTMLAVVESATYIHKPGVPRWQPITLVGVLTCTLVVWLMVELRSARYGAVVLDPPLPWFVHQLRRLPMLAVGYFVVVHGLRHAIFFLKGATYYHLPWRGFIPFELAKASLFYCLWLGLVYGTLAMLQSRERSAQLTLVQKALAETQLAQLQAQLRPHFLFNTLNTASSLMHIDVRRADRVLTRLGDLLRASLGAGDIASVPLREELRLLHLYADIMEERFSGRFLMEWSIEEGAVAHRVPAMLLQPLLENAFQYGVERTTGIQHLRVAAGAAHGKLNIRIRNTGSVLQPGWRAGIGIANCRDRLRVLYGDAASVDLSTDPEGGVVAWISLPIDEANS
jgi:Histidine kinase